MRRFFWVGVACVFGLLTSCFSREAVVNGAEQPASKTASFRGDSAYVEEGEASWYGEQFHGRQTANGEIFDTNAYTAAHKTLPFDTVVTVTNLDNGRRVQVRINDRGPFIPGRIIDLSRAAAKDLGMLGSGTAHVRLEVGELEVEQNPEVIIQLASYRTRENAALLVRKLQEEGINPVIEFYSDYYRVVLQGVTKDQVGDVKSKLAGLGIDNILVRSKK